MRSIITAGGQTVIPAEIRRHFNLSPEDELEWVIENNIIKVILVNKDPISALRGSGEAGAVGILLAERAKDKLRE